jgi:predicted metal-dependent phosphoesterase TrpH
MKKIDLHTHSMLSYDGGIDENGYKKILSRGILDCISITDHNEIAFAQALQKKIGDVIIVGEEIMTRDGEIIGLFLEEKIPGGLSVDETVQIIKKQKGIVYVPHPFETQRKGMSYIHIESIRNDIDIFELFNARGFGRDKKKEALQFAKTHNLLAVSSSDAHSVMGIGSAFTAINCEVNRDTIKSALHDARLQVEYAPLISYVSPSINKLKKVFI